jgi:hypothetical protein
MSRTTIVMAAGLALAVTLSAAPAQAQRVFVSATGVDTNPCSFTSPCRGFQHAHDVAPAGGEIDVLDPAGYGALTISKAISIQGHGYSGITVASGATGITISAPSTAAVTLNGLLIDGAGAGQNGIVFTSGGSLTVTNCVVQNFSGSGPTAGDGILMQPSGTVSFVITNTIVSNNGNDGIHYQPLGGSATANGVIDHVVATKNNLGISINTSLGGGSTTVAISNSIASNNSGNGIIMLNAAPLTVTIDNAGISGNNDGIVAFDTPKVLLGRSAITGNSNDGIDNETSPNTFYSYQDNRINENGTDISAALNHSFSLQ